MTDSAAEITNGDDNKVAKLTSFPLLNLPPELLLKIYAILVKSDVPLVPRELMPAYRGKDARITTSMGSYHAASHLSDKQPAITKVSRQVRKDSLALYYSLNTFLMMGTVTEHSALVPFYRYPKDTLPKSLRSLRKVSCRVRIIDQCPSPASQKAQREYGVGILMTVSKSKKTLEMMLLEATYDTQARRKWLLGETKRCVGQPDEDGFDGIYLLKAATYLYDGIVCKSHKPQWRELGRPSISVDSLFGASLAGAVINAAPITVNPSFFGATAAIPSVLLNSLQQLLNGPPPSAPANVAASAQTQQASAAPQSTTTAAATQSNPLPSSSAAAAATGMPPPTGFPNFSLHSHHHGHYGGYSFAGGLASTPMSGQIPSWLNPPATGPQVTSLSAPSVPTTANASAGQSTTTTSAPPSSATASANTTPSNANPMASMSNGGVLGPFPLGIFSGFLGGLDDYDHDDDDYDDYNYNYDDGSNDDYVLDDN